MPESAPDSEALESFIAGAPRPQRVALRALLALGRRPRGRALLAGAPMLAQASSSLSAMARYDDPALARSLGFDAEAVVARGRALRREEGRP